MDEKLYTCEEIAERYTIKIRTVWDWIRSGKLPAVHVGRLYRVRESDLAEFEQKNLTKA